MRPKQKTHQKTKNIFPKMCFEKIDRLSDFEGILSITEKDFSETVVRMDVRQCWDAAADFFVACGFRQNTAIRFTDSGWGSKSRFFDVQKKPFFDVFFIENESFFAILYYFFTETAFKRVFLKCLNPSGIVSSFLKWV